MKEKNPCEKYQLAITNYVLGEAMPISKNELLGHLKTCAVCRKDLDDWSDNYALMRAKTSDSKPETKARIKQFIKELVAQPGPVPLPDEIEVPGNVFVGKPAGTVWQCIGKEGRVILDDLPKKTGLPSQVAYGAMGWLLHEDKIRVTQTQDKVFLYLTPQEQQTYQANNNPLSL